MVTTAFSIHSFSNFKKLTSGLIDFVVFCSGSCLLTVTSAVELTKQVSQKYCNYKAIHKIRCKYIGLVYFHADSPSWVKKYEVPQVYRFM